MSFLLAGLSFFSLTPMLGGLIPNDGSSFLTGLNYILNPIGSLGNLINPVQSVDYSKPLMEGATIIGVTLVSLVIISFIIK